MTATRILVLSGSARPGSSTRRCADAVAEIIDESAPESVVDVIEIGDLDLPLCDGGADQRTSDPVVAWQRLAGEADAHIWVSPEWHGSYSGLLKNALDLLDGRALVGRPVGLVGQAAGVMGAGTTLEHLCSVARSLGAWVTATQISLDRSDVDPVNADLRRRIERLGGELHQLCANARDVAIGE